MRLFQIVAGMALAATLFMARDAAAQTSPVCIYNSATFSDGAYICAQKSMMLTCQVDGAKATWKPVTDKDINDRCTAPAVAPSQRSSAIKRVRHRFRGAQVYSDPSAKCFNFNGKRYCE